MEERTTYQDELAVNLTLKVNVRQARRLKLLANEAGESTSVLAGRLIDEVYLAIQATKEPGQSEEAEREETPAPTESAEGGNRVA